MVLSLRIFVTQYATDAQFRRLLDLLKQHRAAADELCLFTDYWHHGYYPLPAFARLTALMRRRLDQLRRAGFGSVGINVLDTIGHLNEAWDFLRPLPFPVMVGHDGARSRSCACPNAPAFRQYIRARYRLVARAKPDFIWVDDDIRMHHHGVAYGCFCSRCRREFAEHSGLGFRSRAALVGQLNAPEGGAVREAWVGNNARVLEELLREIAATVHAVDPDIELGLMTAGAAWGSYSGVAFGRWLGALGGNRVRPGGGFYDDRTPIAMVGKAFDIGDQCRLFPQQVRNRQYELENFPYQKLGKSVQSVLNECALALGFGCNGIAFNALKDLPGSLADQAPILAAIEGERRVWAEFAAAAEGLPVAGLWLAGDPLWMARRPVRTGNWFQPMPDYGFQAACALMEIGIPVTPDPAGQCGAILAGRSAELLPNNRLQALVRGGALIDSMALEILWTRGLGELTGVKIGRRFDNGVYERFTRHPLNGRYRGDGRDCRISFWPLPTHTLVPVRPGVADLARLMAYNEADLGSCVAAYAHPADGRSVTLGHGPWARLESSAKRSQMVRLADWVCGGRLPLYIEETVRVVPVVRTGADRGRWAAVLLNASFDASGPLTVHVRGTARRWRGRTGAGWGRVVTRPGKNEVRLTVPSIAPWRYALLIGE